jgi:hypothetical protein
MVAVKNSNFEVENLSGIFSKKTISIVAFCKKLR